MKGQRSLFAGLSLLAVATLLLLGERMLARWLLEEDIAGRALARSGLEEVMLVAGYLVWRLGTYTFLAALPGVGVLWLT
ncbi:MAG: hypothetical protein AAGF12_42115, partial [Myxococcota bacterium]